jgi:hypothetical protein
MLTTLVLVAAATDPGGSGSIDVTGLIAPILSTGLVGIILIMLMFEIGIMTKKSAERERVALTASHVAEMGTKDQIIEQLKQDVTELKESNKGLQELTRDKMLPALVQATDVSRAYVTELARMNERRAAKDGQ